MRHTLICLALLAAMLCTACGDEQTAATNADAGARGTSNAANATSAGNTEGATATAGRDSATAAPQATAQPGSVDLAAGIEPILMGMVRGTAEAKDPIAIERKLNDLLERAGLGTAESRSQVVALVLKEMLAQAKSSGTLGAELTAVQRAALKELARQIASDFYRRLPAGGSAHLGALVSAARSVKLPDGVKEAPWSLLGGFTYEEGMKLPKNVTDLQGAKVGLVGYMMTLEEVEDIHEFLLVESLWSCCFGKPPEVHQVVVVTIPDKKGVDMTPAPLLLTGVLDVGERVEDGFVTSVYRLKAESFRELE